MYRDWSEETIQKALDIYAPKYQARGEEFTRDDAIEVLNNLSGFAEILIDWYIKDKNKEKRTQITELGSKPH